MIFLSQQLVRYLGQAAAGKVPASMLLQLLGLQIPHLLAILLPLSLFLAILVAYGRLYVDNEMVVLSTAGIAPKLLFRPIFALGFGISVLVGVLVLVWEANINIQIEKTLQKAKNAVVIEFMQPGRFRESSDKRTIYYAQEVSRDRQNLRGIFMAEAMTDAKNANTWSILTAESGGLVADQTSQYLVLRQGRRYLGAPGHRDYRILEFDSYYIRLREHSAVMPSKEELLSTLALLKAPSDQVGLKAEFHWRLALPISVLVLVCLAFPLSHIHPREGRYARLLPAILIYLFYINFLLVGKSALATGKVPEILGLWWVHAIFLLFAAFLFYRDTHFGLPLQPKRIR